MSASNWRCLGSLANVELLARVFTAWNYQSKARKKKQIEHVIQGVFLKRE